jgi:Protein of unknown function (DUF3176)
MLVKEIFNIYKTQFQGKFEVKVNISLTLMGRSTGKDIRTVYAPVSPGNPWVPHMFTSLPWTALLSICSVVFLAAVSVVVLKCSNNLPTDSWVLKGISIRPTVVLAVISVVSNALLRYALSEGWRIIWWRRALKGGTVGDLHRNWAHGDSVIISLMSGRHFNLISLAKLVTTLAVIQGPLLQRASWTTIESGKRTIDITTSLAPRFLSPGFTGIKTAQDMGISLLSAQFVPTIREFSRRSPISLKSTCKGECSTQLIAAGFDIYCNDIKQPYNLTHLDISLLVFDTKVGYGGEGDSHLITVDTLHKPDSGCMGNFIIRNCTLREGLVNYNVSLSDGTVSLLPITINKNNTIKLQYEGKDTRPTDQEAYRSSTIGGIALVAEDRYVSTAWSNNTTGNTKGTIKGITVATKGALSREHINTSSNTFENCTAIWSDPTLDILEGIREMMFRAAIADSSSITQTSKAVEEFRYTGNTYRSFIFFCLNLPKYFGHDSGVTDILAWLMTLE